MRTPTSATSLPRRLVGALAALVLALAALLVGPAAGPAQAATRQAPTAAMKQAPGECPWGYVCLTPGGIVPQPPHLVPECVSASFAPPFVASEVRNNTNAVVWVTTADDVSTSLSPGAVITLWPLQGVRSVEPQCVVPLLPGGALPPIVVL
ncbi:hypothetical protein [Yinghuangia seranimata]|uniref:hypothetical protein n=1 Tax=Yinghuangia seranimata TaxID=408067 RepID=UPI00248BA666|nr:hypothetical protein [Yinghuangia seranimata]MDI2131620.1 hypothetical protein [Yinghuangia seranimata]